MHAHKQNIISYTNISLFRVSEQVTKVDYVILQLLLAKHYRLENALSLAQEAYKRPHLLNFKRSSVTPKGFSMEARVYAENPMKHFLPTQGKISYLKLPVLFHSLLLNNRFIRTLHFTLFYILSE